MTLSEQDGSDDEKDESHVAIHLSIRETHDSYFHFGPPCSQLSSIVNMNKRNKLRNKCALCQHRTGRRICCRDCHLSVCPNKSCLGFEHPKGSGHGVCYQCFRNRRTAARPAYVYQLTKVQPQSDSSLSPDPRKPCHPRLMAHAPLAQAVVKLRDKMLLMTSLDSCSCQTHECQGLLTCQHLTSTLSRDSSDAKCVYESNHNFRQDSWHSTEPLAELQSSQLPGTHLIQSVQEEQPLGSVSSALWQLTPTTALGKSASFYLESQGTNLYPSSKPTSRVLSAPRSRHSIGLNKTPEPSGLKISPCTTRRLHR